MPEKVLIYSRFPKAQMERFGERFELLNAAGKPPNEVFSAEQLSDIRAMITAGGTPLGAGAMDLLPKLGAIVCYGTGYDGVDLEAAAKRNIAVGHSPGANAATARGGRLRAGRELGGCKAVADDAPASRDARPQNRRLRHGRDRPQDCGARRRLRDRGRLFQPQQA